MSDVIGWIAFGLSAVIGAYNFYLGFLRRPLYRLFRWEYRWDSGLPAIGSLCLALSLACLWRFGGVRIAAIAVAIVDIGGIPWFVAIMSMRGLLSAYRILSGRADAENKSD